jgi:hypothetical protein
MCVCVCVRERERGVFNPLKRGEIHICSTFLQISRWLGTCHRYSRSSAILCRMLNLS